MQTYKLTIAYDGTNYSGWQLQPNATSIQEIIQRALRTIIKEEPHVIGSGRTDAGVHALAQVAHFKCKSELDLKKLQRSLNGLIPHDIRILKVEKADPTFHAQRSATSKIYHYHLWLDDVVLPFERPYHYPVRHQLDLDLLKKAAVKFVGTHNFKSFANSASVGAASKNAVRTISRLDVIKTKHGLRLEFEGNGFLYKMVRNIVGMLLAVASKKHTLDDIDTIFAAKDRRLAPKSAPAAGLFLVKVLYPQNL